MFESSSIPIDYDPLANIAEFAITYNQKYGTNHPQFYQGSYSQVNKNLMPLVNTFFFNLISFIGSE
jgi:hypothetical protein